ncbi:MAG: 50S ribosomal protein L21 [Candidatus Magasanikbacteria bacterium]|nr:50S ribosomal protein L21 [Candidatus Magasanikbacteria bacterium]
MLAVIATGGKQYLVKTGNILKIEKLPAAAGASATFDQVLLTANDEGGEVKVGTPYLAGVTVAGKVLAQGRAKKMRVEKFKRKIRYHKVYGHRQPFTQVQIV